MTCLSRQSGIERLLSANASVWISRNDPKATYAHSIFLPFSSHSIAEFKSEVHASHIVLGSPVKSSIAKRLPGREPRWILPLSVRSPGTSTQASYLHLLGLTMLGSSWLMPYRACPCKPFSSTQGANLSIQKVPMGSSYGPTDVQAQRAAKPSAGAKGYTAHSR